MSIISIPQPILTPEQVQAAMLDRRIILFATDAERIQALRRYWRILLESAVLNAPLTDDFPALIGALAMQTVQVKNDLENAQAYVKNRALAATIKARADAVKAELKRHGYAMQQRLAPDQHNNEFTLHRNAMIRLRDNHEAAQLAYQSCGQFENGLRHLLDVRKLVDELASDNPDAAIQN